MPREIVTIQVGQCGNQIGRTFWSRALGEHATNSRSEMFTNESNPNQGQGQHKGVVFEESMSTFFRNVNINASTELAPGTEISDLKARACLIDMEDGVLSETMRGPLRSLFNSHQFLSDVSGSGNNWAHGFHEYGSKYTNAIIELIRTQAEPCDSLQSFFLLHSLGGGTGSGLGSKILEILEDEYQGVYRFATSVLPSGSGEGDDVITSPYNSVLALAKLTEHADAVLPIDNARLIDLSDKSKGDTSTSTSTGTSSSHSAGFGVSAVRQGKPLNSKKNTSKKSVDEGGFDSMNSIVARLLTDLTASMRFSGDLNTDLNEITTNLVPFPRMHYLCPSLSAVNGSGNGNCGSRRNISGNGSSGVSGRSGYGNVNMSAVVRNLFTDCFSNECSLIGGIGDGESGANGIRNSTLLASGLFLRGLNIPISTINLNILKIQSTLKMPAWNTEGFKIGICNVPSLEADVSMLSLNNTSGINGVLGSMKQRFVKLYKRKAMVHHYTAFCDESAFTESLESLEGVMEDYRTVGDRGCESDDGGDGGLAGSQGVVWDAEKSEKIRRRYVAF